ncbi:Exodeoxyribonuclease 7 large subunit [bioreactor metagenome]|uniref:Exodeoxyribonuclease 7 large subunit n=1 Tax=bioreactor metagenome TaxID=1076179 RepID=A0A645I1I8_9ZZZZ
MTVLRLGERADNAVTLTMEKRRREYERETSKLNALNPLSVIARGYSAVFTDDGVLVKSVKALKKGDKVSFRATDGTARARITEITADEKA